MHSLKPRDRAAPLLALDAIADGGFTEVEALVDGDAESLMLFRQGQQVRAWLNICPHAGRRLDWAPGQFLRSKSGDVICAAHGASFSVDDGLCVAGPCKGASLRGVAVAVVDGQVVLA
ncbi:MULTISPECIES: Rieske (2Fe-2S) protein [Luteimonas]|uniref:Ferredoxin n=1 Tax=Luteimonas chenhongjianii TaxID=2006110 RepID=A0A290XGZ3_9GAMM|nr:MULTISPECIES: Rieske (2Fe-2S) protein [Luteimonas]ATD68387.1 ferredoxin [Luteimonas chenhongjianii]RPD87928.1 Rieske (2Fe-2S) protein [Luteimonas sp. 100069]